MNSEDSRHITYRRKWQRREAINIFLSKFGVEDQVESEKEEQLEAKEEQKEMGDRNEPLDGKRNDPHKESTLNILNYLAKGQQLLVQHMTQLITNTQANQNNNGNNGNNGNHAKGSNTHIPSPSNTQAASKVTPGPLLPQFLDEQQTGIQGQPVPSDIFNE